jgi:hypothetical protein
MLTIMVIIVLRVAAKRDICCDVFIQDVSQHTIEISLQLLMTQWVILFANCYAPVTTLTSLPRRQGDGSSGRHKNCYPHCYPHNASHAMGADHANIDQT